MEWMLLPYKRYADFSGRSRRMEYWMFRVFEFAVFIVAFIALGLVSGAAGSLGGDTAGGIVGGFGFLALMLFLLGSFIPGLAVTVRRLHDTGKSGWMILIALVPLIGPIALLIFLFSDGDRGDNQYGSDPKTLHVDADAFS